MLTQLKLISLIMVAALGLQACGDDDSRTANAPQQLLNVNAAVYGQLRAASGDINDLFNNLGATNNDGLCDVKVHRISFNTVGGAGEATTSSGVFMLPHGTSAQCAGERPVVLYAHGTNTYKSYDLSRFVPAPDSVPNPASQEGMLLLAAYASKGYAVIAPNYAGYSDSSLDYHPYLSEVQQSTEMMNALDHVREYAGMLGANLSSELFITGLSQGGYVAMATHKALEASGQKVTASMPVSGPYAMLDFIDSVFAGYVNGGATTFAPMALTALDKSDDIYTDPSEVYATAYAGTAENSLPRAGGFGTANLPPSALFSDTSMPGLPAGANPGGFGANHLLADSFRSAYLADVVANPTSPDYKFRKVIQSMDLRNWTPSAPMLLCGAKNDPVVYYTNTEKMAAYWPALVTGGLVRTVDLAADPNGTFAQMPVEGVHVATGLACAGLGLGFFQAISAGTSASIN